MIEFNAKPPLILTDLLKLFVDHWISLHGLITLAALGIYLGASHTLRQRRHPSAAIAWILSLALIPYIALPLYLLLGNRKVRRAPRHQPGTPVPLVGTQVQSPLFTLAATLDLPAPADFEHFTLHQDGEQALHALLALIDSARTTLDICTFVFGNDAVGQRIGQHLMRQARQGVRVRLMVDGIGVYLGGRHMLRPLQAAGIEVVRFVSPWRSRQPGRTNLRNHRKLVIADGQRMWLGGRNIAAEYFGTSSGANHHAHAWTDLSFELDGAVTRQAQQQFQHDWAFATQKPASLPATAAPSSGASANPTVQLIPSGPDQSEDTFYTLLISGCFAARTRILAVSPYFVPDPTLQMALVLAARRGVTVDLLLPHASNHKMADLARHAALRDLAAAGARVWLHPGMIHAKAVVIDEDVAFAGSANLDERSLFLNYEVMLAFYRASEIRPFAQWIDAQRQQARPYVAQEPGLGRRLAEGLVRWVAFQL